MTCKTTLPAAAAATYAYYYIQTFYTPSIRAQETGCALGDSGTEWPAVVRPLSMGPNGLQLNFEISMSLLHTTSGLCWFPLQLLGRVYGFRWKCSALEEGTASALAPAREYSSDGV